MDEEPPARLTENDPKNRLSDDARRRIDRAHIESERIRWEAQAAIDLKEWDNYGPEAKAERNRANLKAARTVLAVMHAEYSEAGLSTRIGFGGLPICWLNTLELRAYNARGPNQKNTVLFLWARRNIPS